MSWQTVKTMFLRWCDRHLECRQ